MIHVIVPILLALSIVGATWLSSLNLALPLISRSAIERWLESHGRKASSADWLHGQIHDAVLATALLRTLLRMAIYVLLLAWMVRLEDRATVTWGWLIAAGLVAAGIIWFTTIVLGNAVARHAGTALIARNLGPLHVITLLCRPFTRAGVLVDGLVRRITGSTEGEQAETDLLRSIEDTHREGGLDVQSAEILENVVQFTNTEVSQIMTVRSDIEGIEFTNDLPTIRAFISHAMHSRIPVYRGTLDNIVGILYLKDLIKYLGAEPQDFKLAPLLRQPIVVPETKPVQELLSVFQRSEVHLAIVIDEYGSTAGLVTIEDVLEEIVGDIRDEHEAEESDEPVFRALDSERAEVDGRFRIDELNGRMDIDLPEDGDYDTLGGFMLSHFGRVPAVGEHFDFAGLRFTTLAATPTHVQRVGIRRLPRQGPTSTGNGEYESAED